FHLLAADLGSVGVFVNQFFFDGFKYLDTELKVFFGKPCDAVYIQSADDGIACHAVIMPVEEHNKPKIEICDADLEI
ncbi:hypothetical protein KAR91_32245, partial [Candidatus Pacearchaeota archaeon]|nr:hypothetical protein [Candidatus Pacearchaeota archaeon]